LVVLQLHSCLVFLRFRSFDWRTFLRLWPSPGHRL
jgi:hypothetical protein